MVRPVPGTGQITIQTEEEKQLEKLRRKGEKKNRRAGNPSGDDQAQQQEWLQTMLSESLLKREESLRHPQDPQSQERGETYSISLTGYSQKMTLPVGTVRKETKEFIEVRIPIPTIPKSTDELIPTSIFPDWAQTAWKGTPTLNRIQTRLYLSAFHSNENLLICAPTGAGKTNIALMTILHEIGQHISGGVIHKGDFKIIYIAPMKALAAEMVGNFSRRLKDLGVVVRELTGDMQLSKREIQETQVIVTTPEKWDVITRKSADNSLAEVVRLLIIDEVHLLHEERGPVIESIVARTLRQVESTQSMIRIVGLSATLPNYQDVALFLRVSETGLFFFDNSYRPVPLEQQYIGVKSTNNNERNDHMTDICLEKLRHTLEKGKQAMIFVHTRKDTVKTAQSLVEKMLNRGYSELLEPTSTEGRYHQMAKEVGKSRNKELRDLFGYSFGIHHAGMLRKDRNLVESLFTSGYIRILVCTATLAWGVNLPAHTVIIKGTNIYDAKHGAYVQLGILDVMQIFGRAGRPQFDRSGQGIIITGHEHLARYLSLMNHLMPIESQFLNNLENNLNAEIVLGTVTNMKEAITWLSYTYMYVRMLKNPLVYGVTQAQKAEDPLLVTVRQEHIEKAAKKLDECEMIRYDEKSGTMFPTDKGRIASHFYIDFETVFTFNSTIKSDMNEAELLGLLSQAQEFENIVVRDDEVDELTTLNKNACHIPVKFGPENPQGKVNILIQAYLSASFLDSFSLASDSAYIVQNATRVIRSLFELALKKGWTTLACRLLTLWKMVDRRIWWFAHPLRQFSFLQDDIMNKLEAKNMTIDKLRDMSAGDIGALVRHPKMGKLVLKAAMSFPQIDMEVSIQPITRQVLRVQLTIIPMFKWSDRIHGSVEPWWIWVEDTENEHIYHTEYYLLHKKMMDEEQKLVFTIPIFEPLPAQYYVHAVSDRWLHAETVTTMSFKNLIIPDAHPPHTELLDLSPLPITALHRPQFQTLYPFKHFNPIQTQVFHTAYHTDHNMLVGAPTGSGKTIVAELAMMRIFNRNDDHLLHQYQQEYLPQRKKDQKKKPVPPSNLGDGGEDVDGNDDGDGDEEKKRKKFKVVYIGPLKALVKERLREWNKMFVEKLGKKMVELTGDYTPDIRALESADIVVTTPEKWDGISRNWKHRKYVQNVGLVVLDEIHLLGEDRGPILEVIVSRLRYISSQTDSDIRIIGLSTALANARDLAEWLGIDYYCGLYNFRPSVRPVPLEAHIQGFSGRHYCPRMASMNKPSYQAILVHSPDQPVLIFVSSRRQTRLTALDLIQLCTADEAPHRFLHMDETNLEYCLARIKDPNLKHTVAFGIGLHHAGLSESDKNIVEELFYQNQIQVLISTSTLAWGVNLPAHLVIIKGTEFYDPKTKRYVDFPITDVLQMMGRAGRPQFDTQGVAVIMVQEAKKNFYRRFLYEPFPVESSLPDVLHDHFNAEIVAGTIRSKQSAIDYLTWTYFFRRLLVNPTYYGLNDIDVQSVNAFLSEKVDGTITDLEMSGCIEVDDDDLSLEPTSLGRIASFYYLSHTTMKLFSEELNENSTAFSQLLQILCNTKEYDELPVRHNEDKLNEELASRVRWKVDSSSLDDPHTKTYLLLQAHFSRMELPISDYYTDLKSVLDQAIRILQAMVDVTADSGWLFASLNTMMLVQMVSQGRWYDDCTLLTLPEIGDLCYDSNPEENYCELVNEMIRVFDIQGIADLACLSAEKRKTVYQTFGFTQQQANNVEKVVISLPILDVDFSVKRKAASSRPPKNTLPTFAPSADLIVSIRIVRHGKVSKKEGLYLPLMPKKVDSEQWWIVLGDVSTGELVALKRQILRSSTTETSLTFEAPSESGQYRFWLYLMCDSFMGLDQQYPIDFIVSENSEESETNTKEL